VAQTIDNLSSAASSHDTGKICNTLLASGIVAKLNQAPGGCQRAIGNALDDTDEPNVTVQKNGVQVGPGGQTATAQVKSTFAGHDQVVTMTLVSQGGSWRISGLG